MCTAGKITRTAASVLGSFDFHVLLDSPDAPVTTEKSADLSDVFLHCVPSVRRGAATGDSQLHAAVVYFMPCPNTCRPFPPPPPDCPRGRRHVPERRLKPCDCRLDYGRVVRRQAQRAPRPRLQRGSQAKVIRGRAHVTHHLSERRATVNSKRLFETRPTEDPDMRIHVL